MKINKAMLIAALCAITTGAVYAKLPPPQLTDEQKTKADDAKAKAADAAKKDGEILTKSQDRVADRYIKAQKAKGITVKPTPIAVAAAPAPVATAAAKK
ncbi:MAG: hypothetical protein JWN94_3386 [Betaproteobacteria bacterium]|nr:hypothetical protein [Betaproteobacteria bacterium]